MQSEEKMRPYIPYDTNRLSPPPPNSYNSPTQTPSRDVSYTSPQWNANQGAFSYNFHPSYPFSDVEQGRGGGSDDSAEVEIYLDNEKLDRIVRFGFIRKTYGIVAAQLALTTFISAAFMFVSPIHEFVLMNGNILVPISIIGSLVTLCYLMCAAGVSQSYPANYILLSVFTVFESIAVGSLCTSLDTIIVMQAFIATTVMVLGLIIFAFQTDYDFTSWMGGLFYALLALIVFALLKSLFWRNSTLDIIYSCGMAVIFSIYLVVDTQLLIGRGKIRLDQDDYILAALMIYLDVINIFISLLKLLNDLRSQ